MWLSLHALRIDFVVFLVRSEEPDHYDTCRILHQSNQSIVIRLDVEDHPATLENADLWMGALHILGCLPITPLHDGPPRLILSPSCLDSSVPSPLPEMALDQVRAHDDHSTTILFLSSQNWKSRFQIMEIQHTAIVVKGICDRSIRSVYWLIL